MTKQVIKPNLVYRLVPMERAVVFQILEMDEGQRIKHARFEARNFVTLYSSEGPISVNGTYSVWLRGNDTSCASSFSYGAFSSNKERDEFISNLHQALREWHEAGGFEEARQYVDERVVSTDGFTYQLGVAK